MWCIVIYIKCDLLYAKNFSTHSLFQKNRMQKVAAIFGMTIHTNMEFFAATLLLVYNVCRDFFFKICFLYTKSTLENLIKIIVCNFL